MYCQVPQLASIVGRWQAKEGDSLGAHGPATLAYSVELQRFPVLNEVEVEVAL